MWLRQLANYKIQEVLSREEFKRYRQAQNSFDKPVIIVTEEDAIMREKSFQKRKKHGNLKAENVRDFGFATSRKFIWEMMAVKLGRKT